MSLVSRAGYNPEAPQSSASGRCQEGQLLQALVGDFVVFVYPLDGTIE